MFPLILSLGTSICLSNLYDTVRLRRSLDKWYLDEDFQNTTNISEDISVIAPLWISPLGSKKVQIVKFSILLTPAIIFILIVGYQMSFGWTNSG